MPTEKTSAYRYGKKFKINIVVDPDQLEEVEALAEKMRTNRSVIFRQAIDFYLAAQREEALAA